MRNKSLVPEGYKKPEYTGYVVRIESPLTMRLSKKPKKRPVPLNLNTYRNLNRYDHADLKKSYTQYMYKTVKESYDRDTPMKRAVVTCYLQAGSNVKFDVANVGSIVDKYLCDCLTKYGVLQEDNYTVIPEVKYAFVGVKPNEPKAIILIEEIK